MPTDTRSHRAWRQTADLILALVEAHRLAPGDRLPGERDLAERLGVSRPSLREALIALEVEGRVEIRMGSGIYVAAGSGAAAEGEGLENQNRNDLPASPAFSASAASSGVGPC